MKFSLSDFSVHGISQARILKWGAGAGMNQHLLLGSRFFTTEPPENSFHINFHVQLSLILQNTCVSESGITKLKGTFSFRLFDT